jgi:uncharacterized protein with HEPN domain
LEDILDATDDAAALAGRGRQAFDADPLLIRSAKNVVTEIGEAAKNLGELTDQIPGVPWSAIAGMRDRTIHRYPEVDPDVLWHTITEDLPVLARTIRAFIDTRP